MTETWTAPELREHLGQVGVVPELVVPVRVTGADPDPPTAHDRARTRKRVVAVGAVVIIAFVVTASLRQALREGFISGSVLLVLLLVGQVALRWFGGPSIMGRHPPARRPTCSSRCCAPRPQRSAASAGDGWSLSTPANSWW